MGGSLRCRHRLGTTAPKVGNTVEYWQGDMRRTGRVCYVDRDAFDVRWRYGGEIGTDTARVRSQDWKFA
jgi:hypothetical protein